MEISYRIGYQTSSGVAFIRLSKTLEKAFELADQIKASETYRDKRIDIEKVIISKIATDWKG